MKTQKDKIIEILKAVFYISSGMEPDNEDLKTLDKFATSIQSETRTLSEGEAVYDVTISELDANAVQWRGATVILAEHFERIAENVSERTAPRYPRATRYVGGKQSHRKG